MTTKRLFMVVSQAVFLESKSYQRHEAIQPQKAYVWSHRDTSPEIPNPVKHMKRYNHKKAVCGPIAVLVFISHILQSPTNDMTTKRLYVVASWSWFCLTGRIVVMVMVAC